MTDKRIDPYRVYTRTEAAALLGVTPRTVSTWFPPRGRARRSTGKYTGRMLLEKVESMIKTRES